MDNEPSGVAIGFTAFAAFLMILVGIFHIIWGIAAIAEDEFFVVSPNYVFNLDVTGWGWVQLLAGIIVLLAGVSLFKGAVWARTVAVIIVGVSAIGNFMTVPYYPLWSLAVLLIDIVIIWALTTHGRDIAASR
jgi:hypothetical protein